MPQSRLVLPLRRLAFFFKLFSHNHKKGKSFLSGHGGWSLSSLSLGGVICLGETEECAEARSPVMGNGGWHRVGDTLAPAYLCWSYSSICLPGPQTANPTKVSRYIFCGPWLEYMLPSPRSQNDKARNNRKLLFLDEESRAYRGKWLAQDHRTNRWQHEANNVGLQVYVLTAPAR